MMHSFLTCTEALHNAANSQLSTMENSSMINKSTISGSCSVLVNVFDSRSQPNKLWIVNVSVSVSSASRFAARPVGAQQAIRWYGYSFLNNAVNARTTVVLPVPGPPVRIIASCSKNVWIASSCA